MVPRGSQTHLLRPLAMAVLGVATLACLPHQRDPSQPGFECAEEVTDWLARCDAAQHLTVKPLACPKGMVVVEVSALRIEITHDRPAFRRVGPLGLSPLGDFADWSKVEPEKRRALDGLAACAENAAGLPAAMEHTYAPVPPKRWPWCLALAAVLGLFAWWRSGGRLRRRQVLPLLVIPSATFLFRWLLIDQNFFHQAGHGPGFIAASHGSGPLYGPGFVELFGWFVHFRPEWQERLVFSANGVLSASLPLSYWLIVRSVGVRGWIPWAVALLVATDPLLGRVGFSESYFGPGAALLGGAAALLAVSFRGTTDRLSRLATVAAAGLLISQAARVHPTTWVASATIPLTLLVLPGALGARVARTILAALGIGLVVVATSGASMLGVLANPLGHAWAPTAHTHATREFTSGHIAAIAVFVLAVPTLALRSWRRVLLPMLVVCASMGAFLFLRSMSVKGDAAIYQWATFSLYVPPMLAALFSLPTPWLRRRRVNRGVAVVLAIVGLDLLAVRWKPMTELLTDQREARLAIQWRKTLPPHAEVWFLANSDAENFRMPLWPADERPAPMAIGHELSTGEFPRVPQQLVQEGGAFYYRSSMCSRPNGRPFCEAMESRLELEPLQTWELPAVTTTSLDYLTPIVGVGLYRIRAARE